MSARLGGRVTDPGYTLTRRHWWSRRTTRLWHRIPQGNSPARGWLVTAEAVRQIERETADPPEGEPA